MKVLITGISGFVGPYLEKLLKSEGHDVFGIDKVGKDSENFMSVDILDRKKVFGAVKKFNPDAIFHLAGFSSVKKSFDQPKLCRDINVNGTKNILDAVLEFGISPKIIVISSAEVYGIPKSVPINETAPLNPVSPYGKSRKEQEEFCREYLEKLHIIILRSFPHIGKGQAPLFVASDFAKQIAQIEAGKEEPVIKVGNLNAKRDFTDVNDIVQAYLAAMEKCPSGETYNICSGRAHSIQEILDILLSFSKSDIKVVQDPQKMRPSDIPVLQGDNSKFSSATGWKPKISIKETLREMLEYWREELNSSG